MTPRSQKGGGQGFFDDSTKVLGNKKRDDVGEGVQKLFKLRDVINERPLNATQQTDEH